MFNRKSYAQPALAGSGLPTNAVTIDATTNRVTSPNFSYDGSGNLTANAPGSSFTYDPENFMLTAAAAAYRYDTQGRRVRKTVGAAVTDYFYFGSQVIAERRGTQWTDYIFFRSQRIAQQTGNTASTAIYLHGDRLGSARASTDSGGALNGTCDYEPYGEVQPASPCSVATNYRFAGMEWDAETGLHHTWFRQYDMNQGSWVSVDPLKGDASAPQSVNRYPYVANDPTNSIDPDGCRHDVFECPGSGGVGSPPFFPGGAGSVGRTPPTFPSGGGFPLPPWWPISGSRVGSTPPFFAVSDGLSRRLDRFLFNLLPDTDSIGCQVCKGACGAEKTIFLIGCGAYCYFQGRWGSNISKCEECTFAVNARYSRCLSDCERNYCGGPNPPRN